MSTITIVNPEQKARLDSLVRETLGNKRPLTINRVRTEFGVNYETARDLMRPYIQRGIGHYNTAKQTFLPNFL